MAHGKTACGAFTLVELLVVIGIILIMAALVVPAFNAMTASNGVDSAAHDVAGAPDTARSYAMANNTYTWVGFFEEDANAPSGTAGVGRLLLSIAASKDGTLPYDPQSPALLPQNSIIQLGKLAKIDGVHLTTLQAGAGGGDDLASRPPVSNSGATISDTTPTASQTPFQFPGGGSTAQYTFTKAVQFSPSGEARINNSTSAMWPVSEIGLVPARGNAALTNDPNRAAIQFTGVAGNVKIYRP